MNLEKEFVPYPESLEMKGLAFDEPCCGYYDCMTKELDTISSEVCERLCKHNTHIKAPTFSQCFRWFREKHGLYVEMFVDDTKAFGYMITYFIEEGRVDKPIRRKFTTYEQAELDCIKELIDIVKNKQP